MSNGRSKPPGSKPPATGKPQKPFLGDDDLVSELDAWDATFDALHGGPEAQAQNAPPPMEWPAGPDRTELTRPAPPDAAAGALTLDETAEPLTFDQPIEDEHATIERGARTRPPLTTMVDELHGDPLETDFSDVGADRPPAALGQMLGHDDESAPVDDLDQVTRIHQSSPIPRFRDEEVEEEEIFTSASRPRAVSAPGDHIDDLAEPPRPAPEPRRGPAIVRRTPLSVPAVPPRKEEVTPSRGTDISMFAESTRVADISEIEEHASRASDAAMPLPDDDYVDIEVSADSVPSEVPQRPIDPRSAAERSGPSLGESGATRRTAHVLRRGDAPTRPPPQIAPVLVHTPEPEEVEPARAVTPAAEDDFSDVAAAVGASDDIELPPIPNLSAKPAMLSHPAPILLDTPEGPSLDDALETLPAEDASDVGAHFDEDDDEPDDFMAMTVAEPITTAALAEELDTRRGIGAIGRLTPPPAPRPSAPPDADAARPEPAHLRDLDLYPRVKTPTSVPPIGSRTVPSMAAPPPPAPITGKPRAPRLATPMPVDFESGELEPMLDLEQVGRNWPEQVAPLPTAALDETSAQSLLVYEREIATVDDSASSAALRVEAGRLCERLTDFDRARGHYDAALLADPRATAALRGLRRLARASGDLGEATRQLDAEIAVAGALERRPLAHYRIDLLMASYEQDLARVAVGEVLDQAPGDVRALLAQLELAFLDGRADEFGVALEALAGAVTDNELRAAVQSARGALAAHHNDTGAAASWFAAAAESDPAALAALLGAIRQATGNNQPEAAARALIDLARQVEATDPVTAAAAAVRAQQWTSSSKELAELGASAGAIAASVAPADPLVARLAAELVASDGNVEPTAVANTFIHWAHSASTNAERAYAAARAAELDASRGAELWASVLALDPGDDYAAAQLRTAHVAAEATQASIDVDLQIASDIERERARLRAAYGMIAQGQLDEAIELLRAGRAARPQSIALAEALGEALAAAGKWDDRAALFAELAEAPGDQLDRDIAQLRSALAWEEAVGAAANGEATGGDPQRTTISALDAWERVLERASSPSAHAAAIVLASRLGDAGVLGEVLMRAQGAEKWPWAAASLGMRRARQVVHDDPQRHETILRDLQLPFDDPRRTVALVLGAARQKELGDAARALEERAALLEATKPDASRKPSGDPATEVAALRLRAAQLSLDAGDAPKATALLHQVEQALPQLGVVADLLAAARRRAGDRPSARPGQRPLRRTEVNIAVSAASSADAFARVMRDGDLAMTHGDTAAALAFYQRALELKPGDPLAAVPLVRVASQLGDPAPVAALAVEQLKLAEDSGDNVAKAAAYELLAHIDRDLRNDPGSAQIALENAAQADPSRIDLLHQLERQYIAGDQMSELLRLRKAEIEATPPELPRDRTALSLDLAALSTRDGRPELELADLYRSVLAIDPRTRLALLHLEAIVRRSGFSTELAELEEKIATYFEGDARTQAAFFTRAGETLAELGHIDEAVQRFGRAEAALPGHVPALEGWRQAALKGQLWIDVAEAATRQAAAAEGTQRAALHHFAGVALMDKALVGEKAMAAFKRALEADPTHKDAFLRLRILLEEDANHDELAILLAHRLEVEPDPGAKIEMHRALAELHRNFLSDRETAKRHYRAILESDANDLRAHAAIADIAWEQGNWQEAADALMARARLEREPDVLKTLCFRLGLIYADRLVDVPMALKAFQRALTYQPDDENTLIRLADLATQVGEWKLALGACERLVKNESDPDRRALHLHRVAKIFKDGFGDVKRAERALNLALDGAPTNDEALAQLVKFYRDANDITSVRVHLNRVAGAMRARVAKNPQDGVAYRVISRAMFARANANVPGSIPIARSAAELAELLGTSGEPEQKLLQLSQNITPQADLTLLTRPEADEVLFPRGVQVELRQVFHILGDRIAKHVGVDLRPYGATRGDRLRGRDNPVAAVAQTVASGLGFGEIDVYVSNRQPWAMVVEPTSPVSLVIGASIAQGGGDAIRFAAGGALKLAQASLAIPARLPVDELGVLVVALLRLFQPDFPITGIEPDAVAAQSQKLRRLIPTGLLNELRPFALAIDPQRFRHDQLSRDLKIAGLRAGLVASGSVLAGLRILSAQAEAELPSFLADPVAQGLVAFAIGEDHAVVAR